MVHYIGDILQKEMIKQALEFFDKTPLIEEEMTKEWIDAQAELLEDWILDAWDARDDDLGYFKSLYPDMDDYFLQKAQIDIKRVTPNIEKLDAQ